MKRIGKSAELLWVIGIFFLAMGVSLCSKANLGVSMIAAPAFIIYEAIAPLWSCFSVGMVEYMVQGVLLIILCITVRRFNWRYLLAFAVAVFYGFVLDFFLLLTSGITVESVWSCWLLLLVGDVITGFGVACLFQTYLPLQAYELFVSEISARFHKNLNKTKWTFDLSLFALSLLLVITLFGDLGTFDWTAIGTESFHSIGLGTVITVAINAPIIAFMSKLVRRYFEPTAAFPKIEKALKLNNK